MIVAPEITALLGGFLMGSIPFAWWIGRLRGVDLLTAGSRNPGATNLGRLCGKSWGYAAFVLDSMKGAAPVLIVDRWIVGAIESGAVENGGGNGGSATVIAAVAAVAGHVFSPFLKFRGGKGVATSAGALGALCPSPALVIFVVWLITFAWTRTIGMASIAAGLTGVVIGVGLCFPTEFVSELVSEGPLHGAVLIGLGVVVLWRHRENWERHRASKRGSIENGRTS